MSTSPRHALVLAGSRGPTDPVAAAAGLPHKALVPADGTPMLERVCATLFDSGIIEHITLCTDQALADYGLGENLARYVEGGRITLAAPKASPSESVAHMLASMPKAHLPLLVTTADHPLLTADMIRYFTEKAPGDADIAFGVAEAGVVRSRYPNAVRTFYRFKGLGYSGCNLFLLKTPEAHRVITFWQDMERHRKRPWRLVAAVGGPALVRFLLGRLSLEDALDYLSARIGAKIMMVAMPFAEAAIDVDKPGDLDLAEAILRARG